jgi:hypothetical protein
LLDLPVFPDWLLLPLVLALGLELGLEELGLELEIFVSSDRVELLLIVEGLTGSQFQIDLVCFTLEFSLLTFVEFVTPLPVS